MVFRKVDGKRKMTEQWYNNPDPVAHSHRNALRDFVKGILDREEFKGFTARRVSENDRLAVAELDPKPLFTIPLTGTKIILKKPGHEHEIGIIHTRDIIMEWYAGGVIPQHETNPRTGTIKLTVRPAKYMHE